MILKGKTRAEIGAENLLAEGDSVLDQRRRWYQDIGDPMYFKEQRGEVEAGTWKKAIEEMKIANPYPKGYTPGAVLP